MKTSEWKRLLRPLLGPSWATFGSLAYLRPTDWVLHGITFERSDTPDHVHLVIVTLPMYQPHDVLVLSWSRREPRTLVAHRTGTDDAVELIRRLIALAEQEWAQASRFPPRTLGAEPLQMAEARAYAAVVHGAKDHALAALADITTATPAYEWQRTLLERARGIETLVAAGDIDVAIERIRGFRQHALQVLAPEQ